MKKPVLLAALTLLTACSDPSSDAPVIDETAQETSDVLGARGRFLVAFREAPQEKHRALVRQHGGTIRRELPEIAVFAVEMSGIKVSDLMRDPSVDYVEEDAHRTPSGLTQSQLTPSMGNGLYGLITTGATATHTRGISGTGIKVGVADTGLDYTHPDIAPAYKGGIDTVSDDNDPWWNNDINETHGTHVAGTIVAAQNTSGVYGVAYNAELYHARVLGPTGGFTSDIMAGVRWLVETAGCRVINLSLGGGRATRTEDRFYQEMRSKGALVIAATGNEGARKVSYPAAYAINIAVGAVDSTNTIASFSNQGRAVDVVAPGVGVLSSVPAGTGSEVSLTTASGSPRAFTVDFAGKTAGLTGALVHCGLGQPGECPASVSGNIALIQRGTISFAEKVQNAMNQGAAAAILYNNVAGDFGATLGAATTSDGRSWIPAVTVSDAVGASLVAQVGSSATVVDQVSSWALYDGTSMATPHVSGVVALIWSSNPALTAAQVENFLFTTTTDLGPAGVDNAYGRGLVNASAAVRAASGR
jgi:subtilisin family serine protease